MNEIGVRIARALVKIFGRLPLGFHYAMSRLVCWVVKDVMRYRHDVVMTNLARSFPEKKYRELESIADAYYRHLGDIIVEALWFRRGAHAEKRHIHRNESGGDERVV